MTTASPDISTEHLSATRLAMSRPRVLGWMRSAAVLDGDWGTSVAYVLGIGFALAGYGSFWQLLAMMALTTLVAVNYVSLCRLYPNGGGVYSLVCHQSNFLAVIGALLLAVDTIVTIALSILDGRHYVGVEHPVALAIAVILIIGSINWFGPRHSGGLALLITFFTLVTIAEQAATFGVESVIIGGQQRSPSSQFSKEVSCEHWAVCSRLSLRHHRHH